MDYTVISIVGIFGTIQRATIVECHISDKLFIAHTWNGKHYTGLHERQWRFSADRATVQAQVAYWLNK